MSDLREQIHGKPLTPAEQVFLDYHDNSPWAHAKVDAGIRLFPEAIAYMERELAERKRADAARENNLKDDPNAQQPSETPPPKSSEQRGPAAAPVGGLPGPDPQSA